MNKNIAVVILNETQLKNILPCVDELLLKNYEVDIYCNDSDYDIGFKNMFQHTRDILSDKYNVYTTPLDKKYKILLEPYPSGMDIKSEYKIRYRYSNISAKPNIVYKPENYIQYDAILCSGTCDANYLNVYSKTYITANCKYANFKRKKHPYEKPVLLYLPTYGDESSVDLIYDALEKLKAKYYIVTKLHHGTTFLEHEKKRIELLKNAVDEIYDSSKDLADLFSIADVVLTDNSGSIFEAMYVEVPVAVFCDDINRNKQQHFNTIQYDLYCENILPYTNDINLLAKILKQAQSEKYFNKQKRWAKENFYRPKNVTKDFMDVIGIFMEDKIDKKYYEMHDFFKTYFYNMLNENKIEKEKNEYKDIQIKELTNTKDDLNAQIKQLNNQINTLSNQYNQIKEGKNKTDKELEILQKQLRFYQTGILYRIANKIYRIKNKK